MMLIGTNICVYLATVLCTHRLIELGLGRRADLYSSLIMPPLLLVFAEIIPKSLFYLRADTLMYRTAWLLNAFRMLLYPLLAVVGWMGGLVRLVAGKAASAQDSTFTVERFRFFLSEGAAIGIVSPYQQTMADNILRVKSLQVSTAMVPLDKVVMIPEDASVDRLREVLRDHRFSRIPVCSGSRSNITGVINVMDILAAGEAVRGPVRRLTRLPQYLDRGTSVADALYALQKARGQMAVVTDAEGTAVGIITIKDLVEEIVGELEAW